MSDPAALNFRPAAEATYRQMGMLHDLFLRYGALPEPTTVPDHVRWQTSVLADMNARISRLESHDTYEDPEDE
jgi:hypothetical protein